MQNYIVIDNKYNIAYHVDDGELLNSPYYPEVPFGEVSQITSFLPGGSRSHASVNIAATVCGLTEDWYGTP